MNIRIVSELVNLIRKIRLLDWLIVFIIFLAAGYFLINRLNHREEWISVVLVITNEEWWWEGSPPPYWYTDTLEKGMIATNSFGEKIAEITDVKIFDNGGYRRRGFITINVRGSYEKKREIYLFNYQPLQIGKMLELTFEKNNVKGMVTYIDQEYSEFTEKKIEVKLYEVKSWQAEQYIPGLEMKDSQDRLLAVVEDVQSELSSSYEFSDIRGKKLLVTDPQYRDLTLQLRVKSFQSGGVNYFIDRSALKVGEEIWFQFPNIAIQRALISQVLQ